MASQPSPSPLASTPADFRPMKSIIIGAGQPIVVPGQKNITNDLHSRSLATSATQGTVNQSPIASKSSSSSLISSLFGKNDIREAIPDLSHLNITEQTVVSVEEFCPDGEVLEKGFLDDVPGSGLSPKSQLSYRKANSLDPGDSDSDGNENGNPLVARFHDEPADDFVAQHKASNQEKHQQKQLKTNPLSKSKNKSADFSGISEGSLSNRKSSVSSDDIEIPTVMKIPNSADNSSGTGCGSNEEFDSWLSDTNQRRSPEGGEDITSLPSADKTSIVSIGSNETDVLDSFTSSALKEKKHKSKKKKEKKEKSEREDGKKKKKRRSRECDAGEFLNGSSHEVIQENGVYEAI